ncbi:signal peptidase II [Granulicella aggregans]|uniref:signal peptidase II n=1 Tax=Granulicella aggregans TaxID=474949 RepID=UPI0021E0F30C|nr:signal peptidase II [Granulicella aggregans]
MNLHTMPFPPRERTRDWRIPLLILSALVIVADRLSKLWIVHHIPSGSARVIIPGVFRLTHVLNTGAAFSLFADSVSPGTVRIGLIVFSVVAAFIVLGLLLRTGRYLTISSVALALILGGAVGNLYDRARLYSVVDFLEVTIVHYHWPDFNVADSCIVIGACLLVIEIFRPQPQID